MWRPALQHTLSLRYGWTLEGCYSLVRLVCFSLLHAIWSFSWCLQCKEAFIRVMKVLAELFTADNALIRQTTYWQRIEPRTVLWSARIAFLCPCAWPQCSALGKSWKLAPLTWISTQCCFARSLQARSLRQQQFIVKIGTVRKHFTWTGASWGIKVWYSRVTYLHKHEYLFCRHKRRPSFPLYRWLQEVLQDTMLVKSRRQSSNLQYVFFGDY